MMLNFVMAGGGTGGHVIPALAVAGELRRRGYEAVFIGTRGGLESRLAPEAGFRLELIEIAGLQRTGWRNAAETLWKLPGAVLRSRALLKKTAARAVFSMGGYVAGPVVLAALLSRIPVVAMEPNALPGLVTRMTARWVRAAFVSFEETRRWFPPGRAEVSGLPVREAFFELPPPAADGPFTVLVTGGSRGSRALNRAARESWPHFRTAGAPVRWIVQTGAEEEAAMAEAFRASGLEGRVAAFIGDMPAAFGEASLVVGRAGAGAVSELAAAGRPSLLVPFPYAADDHQTANARALEKRGAARWMPESELSGESLFRAIEELRAQPERRAAMARAGRASAWRGAAGKAADALERAAGLGRGGAA
jgi:UDP-N-acetylglucosamine--N-acetylmuramyl-(pentapeptide) pyrophosphoryl-undecaprenol N-acetylglucosamine transferase